MPSIASIRKYCALLLVFCFFLPLSKCSAKMDPGGRPPAADIYHFPDQMAVDGLKDFASRRDADSLLTLLVLLTIFFAPFACLKLGELAQAIVGILIFIPAAYVLPVWTFMFGTPQIGGLLAVAGWLMLFVINVTTLGLLWRRRARAKAACPRL